MHHTFIHILNYIYKKYINYLRGIKCTPIFFPCGSYFDASDPPEHYPSEKHLRPKFYAKHLLQKQWNQVETKYTLLQEWDLKNRGESSSASTPHRSIVFRDFVNDNGQGLVHFHEPTTHPSFPHKMPFPKPI
jgi:hypothetical protein